MKNTMIELISDDELIDLLVDTALEVSVPDESNFLAMVRDELKARLTKRTLDSAHAEGCGCFECVYGKREPLVLVITPRQ